MVGTLSSCACPYVSQPARQRTHRENWGSREAITHRCPELRLTDFGYAKLPSDTRRTQPPRLSHRQSLAQRPASSGNVINPPPPAIALITPPTMLAKKNKTQVATI